jgi:hypothetical protein
MLHPACLPPAGGSCHSPPSLRFWQY